MANSRKLKRSSKAAPDLVSHVAFNIRNVVRRGERVVVALSGGVDSIVLLDIFSRIAGRRGLNLAGLHINHQISPKAAQWAAFCREACDARSVPLRVVRVQVKHGDSLEAAARAARYDVFRAQTADHVVLAHNQDDQAETVLLQLLRGAGVKGLSAMPMWQRATGDGAHKPKNISSGARRKALGPGRPALSILRPLLDVPRSVIEDYAGRWKLRWIEDESNEDTYFARNFLRHEILPLIAKRFPFYRTTLTRAARHLAETAQMLEELAAIDGTELLHENSLQVAGLRRLTPMRARNLLRQFLRANGAAMPSAERLAEALRQILTARSDTAPCIDLGAFELRRFGGELYVIAKWNGADATCVRPWDGERRLEMPELRGVLTMAKGRGTGISLSMLRSRPVTIRLRRGGESIRLDERRPRRLLKKLFQESRIPPWRRDYLPLLFVGRELVWVPEIGIASGYQASAGESSVKPEWRFCSTEHATASLGAAHTHRCRG